MGAGKKRPEQVGNRLRGMAEIGIHDQHERCLGLPGSGDYRPGQPDVDLPAQQADRFPILPGPNPLAGVVTRCRIDKQYIELEV